MAMPSFFMWVLRTELMMVQQTLDRLNCLSSPYLEFPSTSSSSILPRILLGESFVDIFKVVTSKECLAAFREAYPFGLGTRELQLTSNVNE